MSKITKKDIKEQIDMFEEMIKDRELNIKVIRGEIGILVQTVSRLKAMVAK